MSTLRSTRSSSGLLHLGLTSSAAGLFLLACLFGAPERTQAKEKQTEKKAKKSYRADEVAAHNSTSTGIWCSYKGKVYDITKFVDVHPGGRVVTLAAGKDLAPFWAMYTIHTASDTALKMLEPFEIGNLVAEPAAGATTMPCLAADPPKADDYDFVLKRSPLLSVLSKKPFNAEPPSELLSAAFITPADISFIRSHIHTPKLDADKWSVEISGLGIPKPVTFTLKDLQDERVFPRHTVTAAMQCAGNRRATLAAVSTPDSPLAYHHMVIHNSTYYGIRLKDLLAKAKFNLNDAISKGAAHMTFEGYDHNGVEGFGASCDLDKGLDPDSLVCWEMNGAPLTPDHGYPVRGMIPGIGGQRSTKWLKKIVISDKESQSFWQQKDKVMPPWNPNPEDNPAFQDMPVQSAICEPATGTVMPKGVDELTLKGYAWTGMGRGIMRVDLTTDNGRTWKVANLHHPDQPKGRVWAWTLWDATLPLPKASGYAHTMRVCARAVDNSYNVQPEDPLPLINQRGFMCNSWHCIDVIRPPK